MIFSTTDQTIPGILVSVTEHVFAFVWSCVVAAWRWFVNLPFIRYVYRTLFGSGVAYYNPLHALSMDAPFMFLQSLLLSATMFAFWTVKLTLDVVILRHDLGNYSKQQVYNVAARIPVNVVRTGINSTVHYLPILVNALLCGVFMGVGVACINSALRFFYFETAVKFSNHSSMVMCACEAISILLFVFALRGFYHVYKVLHESLPKAWQNPMLNRAQYEDVFMPGVVGAQGLVFFVVASMAATLVFTLVYVFSSNVTDTSGDPTRLVFFTSGFMTCLRFQSFLMAIVFACIFLANTL